MDGLGGDGGVGQPADDLVGPVLGAGEDQGPRDLGVLQQVLQQGRLGCRARRSTGPAAPCRPRGLGRHLHVHRIVQERVGQRPDFARAWWPRTSASAARAGTCAITRRMSWMKPMSSMRSASSRTRISTSLQRQQPLVEQVQQPARRGHQDVHAAVQRLRLRALPDAAEDDRVPQRRVLAVARGSSRRSGRPARAWASGSARGSCGQTSLAVAGR